MEITLSATDLAGLSPDAQREVLALFKPGGAQHAAAMAPPAASLGGEYQGIDMSEVVDLSFKQIQTWMETASEKTKLGLRVIADKGPVIRAQDLIDAGIENTSHFQSRTTVRTRTVTENKSAFLLGWDDWYAAADGQGKYAVTSITHQSLRRYFHLDQA